MGQQVPLSDPLLVPLWDRAGDPGVCVAFRCLDKVLVN